ncbi:MAG TPA: VWA domain-containing protein [Pyrinomonadaceae bacterium]
MNPTKFIFSLFVFLLSVTTAFAQDTPKNPEAIDVIKVDSNLVSVPVIVSDREGRYVPNLKVDDFKLFDNSSEQKITYFDAAEEPLNIAILLDTSRSTEGALDDIRGAAKNFLKELRPQDRAMIVSFDAGVHRLSELTSDRKTLEDAIKNAKVGKDFGTTLNDAVIEVARRDFRPLTGRKAIILLSDGDDFGSSVQTDDLLNEESESDTMVYSIYYAPEFQLRRDQRQGPRRSPDRFPRRRNGGIFGGRRGGIIFNHVVMQGGPGPRQGRRNRWNGADFMQELSEVTSGRFYQSERTDLKKTFSLIAEELRHQYRLGFYPGDIQKDGSLHQLRVKVDTSDVAVRARQQYRAQ